MAARTVFCCMGCQPMGAAADSDGSRPERISGPGFFSTYRAAAAHYTRSKPCNSSNRGIKSVKLQFREVDNEAGGSGGAGTWPPQRNTDKQRPGQFCCRIIACDITSDVVELSFTRKQNWFIAINMNNDVVKNMRKKETTSLHCDIAQTIAYDIVCDIAS